MPHVLPFERVLEHLAVEVEPFAVCKVSPGWRLTMGGAASATFHFALRGRGRLVAGSDFSEPIAAHCLCVVPAGVAHTLESGGPITSEAAAEDVVDRVGDLLQLVAGADEDGLTVACGRADATYAGGLRLFEMLRRPVLIDFSDSLQMQSVFERILDEQRNPGVGSKAMTAALMNQCLVLALRRLRADPDCPLPWLASLSDPRIALLLQAVLEQPEGRYSVASLAESMFMSRSVFSRHFKALFGLSPLAFVNQVRLQKAAKLLLDTDLTVDAVARRVGYSSRSHFSHAFCARYGTRPTDFRSGSNGSAGVPTSLPQATH